VNRSQYSRALEIFRKGEIKTLWFKILGETLYRRLLLFNKDYHEPIEQIAETNIETRVLQRNDIGEYINFRPDTTNLEVIDRLGSGHICFITLHEDKVIGAAWVATQKAYIDYLDCYIELADNEVYFYDGFILPSYRGKNIMFQFTAQRIIYLREKGYSYGVSATLPENRSALSLYKKNRINYIGHIGYFKIGPWKKYFCKLKPEYVDQSGIKIIRA